MHALNAQLAHCESCFVDAGGLGSRAQHIRLDGYVAGVGYSFDLVEEAASGLARGLLASEAEAY